MNANMVDQMKRYLPYWPAAPVLLLLLWLGSGSASAEKSPHEWFVCINQPNPQTRDLYLDIITAQAAPGDLVHLVHRQELVTTVTVPAGTPQSRLRSQKLTTKMTTLKEFFGEMPNEHPAVTEPPLGLYEIPATVRALRQTNWPCRVLLTGIPLYLDQQRNAGWSMEAGVVPSDSSLELESSPFYGKTDFPEGTQLSWLLPTLQWGVDQAHREAVTRFQRLFIQTRGGTLVRMTIDPHAALNFDLPQFAGEIQKIPGPPTMIQVSFEAVRAVPPRESTAPVEVPLIVPQAMKLESPQDASALLDNHRGLEHLLGSHSEIECLILLDTSGSMAHVRSKLHKILLELATAIPQTSARVRLGMICYCNGGLETLPLQDVLSVEKDSGQSYARLKHFLETVQVKGAGSGANVDSALSRAMEIMESSKTPHVRQVLVLLGDTGLEEVVNAVQLQHTEDLLVRMTRLFVQTPGHDRRVFAFFHGTPGKTSKLFERLGALNAQSRFATDPQELLLGVLKSMAVSGH